MKAAMDRRLVREVFARKDGKQVNALSKGTVRAWTRRCAMTTTVNLLDCTCEPSDEQLEALMRDAAAEARARAAVANAALRNTLAAQTAEVRVRYHLPKPRAAATAAL